METNILDNVFNISMRNDHEETMWWNPQEREKFNRPGPGFLPAVLTDTLHSPDYLLYSVKLKQPEQALPADNPAATAVATAPQPPSNQAPPAQTADVDSRNETMKGLPHPGAYFCPNNNGWYILIWASSPVEPVLAQSYRTGGNCLPPDMSRRTATSCVDYSVEPSMRPNKTHHFHKYAKAVDSHKLTPPVHRDPWRTLVDDSATEDEEGMLFDLYVCCQCSFYCVSSGLIPAVVHPSSIEAVVQAKKDHPITVNAAAEVEAANIIQAVVNAVAVTINAYGSLGIVKPELPYVQQMLEQLGFEEIVLDDTVLLKPPTSHPDLPQGKETRHRLIRAWWELNSWLAHFAILHPFLKESKSIVLHVQLASARQVYHQAIGVHPSLDQTPGGLTCIVPGAAAPLGVAWRELGLPPMTSCAELLAFAYLAQCRCDPAKTAVYFTHFTNIVAYIRRHGTCPMLLQKLLALEQMRERFTVDDVAKAATELGFGEDNTRCLAYSADVTEEAIAQAWNDCAKRSRSKSPSAGAELRRRADRSLKRLAEYRGSAVLWTLWQGRKQERLRARISSDVIEIDDDRAGEVKMQQIKEEYMALKLEAEHHPGKSELPTVIGGEMGLDLQVWPFLTTCPELFIFMDPDTPQDSNKVPSKSPTSVVYIFNTRRVLAKRQPSYAETISSCRILFPEIQDTNDITLHTSDPCICQGEQTQISEESWDDIADEVKSITVSVFDSDTSPVPDSASSSIYVRSRSPVVSSYGLRSSKRRRVDT